MSEDEDLSSTVSVEIPDELFISLALEAHQRDITLNQLINHLVCLAIESEKE